MLIWNRGRAALLMIVGGALALAGCAAQPGGENLVPWPELDAMARFDGSEGQVSIGLEVPDQAGDWQLAGVSLYGMQWPRRPTGARPEDLILSTIEPPARGRDGSKGAPAGRRDDDDDDDARGGPFVRQDPQEMSNAWVISGDAGFDPDGFDRYYVILDVYLKRGQEYVRRTFTAEFDTEEEAQQQAELINVFGSDEGWTQPEFDSVPLTSSVYFGSQGNIRIDIAGDTPELYYATFQLYVTAYKARLNGAPTMSTPREQVGLGTIVLVTGNWITTFKGNWNLQLQPTFHVIAATGSSMYNRFWDTSKHTPMLGAWSFDSPFSPLPP